MRNNWGWKQFQPVSTSSLLQGSTWAQFCAFNLINYKLAITTVRTWGALKSMKLVKIETSESGKPSETCEPGDSNGWEEGWWRHLPVVRGDLVLNEAVDEGANPLLTQTLAPNILLRSNFFQILASNIKYCHQIFYCALTFSTWMSRARLRLSREVNHRLAWLWPLKQ